MSVTPLSITKTRFRRTLRGYEPTEVEELLQLIAEEMAATLANVERLEGEVERREERLRQSEQRERELQETLLRAQRVSDEILANAQREAQILVREAELTADRIVQQAIDRSQDMERRISELQHRRRELQLRFKNTLDLYTQILEADSAEEDRGASIHRLARPEGDRRRGQGGA